MPNSVCAETGSQMTSPPQSSGTSSCSVSSCLTRSGLAVGLSILLMATMMGTPAALEWLMASTVWGMMPSSAATTSTTMSVHCAPRMRIAVKASWPGVSRKVICWPWISAVYAPMCCVMPPASPAVTWVLRMQSSREVLPWSTWPMMVTTGGRGSRFSSESSSTFSSISISSEVFSIFISSSMPNSEQTSSAVS